MHLFLHKSQHTYLYNAKNQNPLHQFLSPKPQIKAMASGMQACLHMKAESGGGPYTSGPACMECD